MWPLEPIQQVDIVVYNILLCQLKNDIILKNCHLDLSSQWLAFMVILFCAKIRKNSV